MSMTRTEVARAIGKHDVRVAPLGRAAQMAAVFVEVEDVPVGEPGQRVRQLVALALRSADRHDEAVLDLLQDHALDAADVVDIGDYPLADLAEKGLTKDGVAGRNLEQLAGAFAPVGEHATAEQAELNALETPPVEIGNVCECSVASNAGMATPI